MQVQDFLKSTKEFFEDCQEEMERKSPDYSDCNNVMLGDIFSVAEDMGIRPSFVAYIQARKHLQAINTWMRNTHLRSEDIHHRLMDATNYMAILSIVIRRESVTMIGVDPSTPEKPDYTPLKDVPHVHQGEDTQCHVCGLASAAKVHHVMTRPPNLEDD